jgi:hypothetical protein
MLAVAERLPDLRALLATEGFVVLRGFYSDPDIFAVQAAVSGLLRHVAAKHGLAAPVSGLYGYRQAYAAVMFEGAKQLPALHKLITSRRSLDLIEALRPGFAPGIAADGPSVRIDMPDDEGGARWKSPWHQEFPFQGRSLNGLVFWSPLVPITEELGPVEVCIGSHAAGPLPIYDAGDGGVGRSRSYVMRMVGEEMVVDRYRKAAPLTEPGDVIVMDYLTIHRSGQNRAAVPRWSMLWRYFDYADDYGFSIGWKRPATFGEFNLARRDLPRGL